MQPFEPTRLPLGELDWTALIPAMGAANRAVAKYAGILFSLPNPDILLSPLTTQEAVLSSRIEGTQATLGEVFKFEAGEEPEAESRRQDIFEIINYRMALEEASRDIPERPFTLNLLLRLHGILLDSVRGRNMRRGQFRREQNWIGKAGCSIEEAEFVPPRPERLPEALDNWEKYYHADDLDPLAQLAVVHAQFEILHPFLDGNGRLGRILIPIFLYERQILTRPVFYLSGYFDSHRDEYVRHLRNLGRAPGSWNAWVSFFLEAVRQQAEENARKVHEMMALYGRLKQHFIETTRSQFAVPLLDALFRRPVFQSTILAGLDGMPSKPMIMTLLGTLKENGVLKVLREGSGRRPQVLALAELVNLAEGRTVI